MSTPNVRGQASADAAALALSADKRRNKLGYHRTSVACGKNPTDKIEKYLNCLSLEKQMTDSHLRALSTTQDQMHSSSS
jgi:hypothetical protein